MTLAAALVIDSVPVVIADMLVSGVATESLHLPTSGDVSCLLPNRNKLTGLGQKIALLSDNLVVAYAGDVLNARVVFRALRRELGGRFVSVREVEQFFTDKQPLLKRIALVGFLVEPSDATHQMIARRIALGAGATEFKDYGEVDLIGTGADLLKLALDSVVQFEMPEMPRTQRALCKAHAIIGAMLREEHATGGGLVNADRSGGLFQVAAFVDGKFSIFSDVTHVIGDIEVRGSELESIDITHPYLVLRQFRQPDGVEYVRCARWAALADGSNKDTFDITTHSIPLIDASDEDVRNIAQIDLSFHSPMTVETYLIVSRRSRALMGRIVLNPACAPIAELPDGRFETFCEIEVLRSAVSRRFGFLS
jgi:hypothetical protein